MFPSFGYPLMSKFGKILAYLLNFTLLHREYFANQSIKVSWDGLTDPENPKNWTSKRKWTTVLMVSGFAFISQVSSTMVAPALPALKQDLNVSGDVVVQMMLSIFILAYAVGPLFLGPLSEMYGRIPVLQLASLFFLVFNTVCGFAQNSKQMLAFRFLAGIGGSAPLAIGGGILVSLKHKIPSSGRT